MIDDNLEVITIASYKIKKIEPDLYIHKQEVFRKNDNNTHT